ncbi:MULTISPECIES: cytochrome c oxidase subunit 4 [unclassified Streptomyces]|jgi:hypothetical protein|uniref:aa3-type cytochrome oxidase subunit IV n=1 Tax=unclassified Streptomyces TaxID=2593676 RepID=UPI0004C1EBD4|nr:MULTISPECIES: cytochrome c oxidase subunit 4 [unclassified Streptomyces]
MKHEAYLFAGVSLFFLVTATAYGWFSREPAGTVALLVSCLMAAIIAFFSMVNYRRKGLRPEDRPDSEIRERGGPVDFFPPHSPYPVVTALGVTVLAIGVVYHAWLALLGVGIAGSGVFGLAFQYLGRDSA